MRHVLTILALAICAVSVSAAQQQAKKPAHPDFSGTWIVDVEKTNLAAADRQTRVGRAGAALTFTQDAMTLTIARPSGTKDVYRFDGKEVANKVPQSTSTLTAMNPDSPAPGTDVTYKSEWQGQKLVTTMTGRSETRPTMTTETRYLEGQWMVIVTVWKRSTGDVTRITYWKRVPKSEHPSWRIL